MMKYTIVILLFLPLFLFSQTRIEGIVLDSLSKEPVSFATVFINGTTNGTVTDSTGFFVLEDVLIPCKVIASHLSFSTSVQVLETEDSKKLVFQLKLNDIELPQATVVDNGLRQSNVGFFKRFFLGADDWGKKAKLENDDALIFTKKYTKRELIINNDIKKGIQECLEKGIKVMAWKEDGVRDQNIVVLENILSWNRDSTQIVVEEESLNVTSSEPLIIDLPLLGYKLQVADLDFLAEHIEIDVRCLFSAFYFYEPYVSTAEKIEKKHSKNRKTAYFNSPHHFFRALYSNQLAQNGYQIIDRETGKSIEMDVYLKPEINNIRPVIGLQSKNLKVIYHSKYNGDPVDITRRKAALIQESKIIFLQERCNIRSDGSIPLPTIIFGGMMGEKRVGSMLPNNYEAENN